HAQVDFQLRQMLEIVKLRLGKRGVDLKCLEVKEPQTTLATAQQEVLLRHGIDAETAKLLTRLIKDSKLKVQASLQGEKVRVSGKQRDDLQAAMALLCGAKLDRPLQFNNFRDLGARAPGTAPRWHRGHSDRGGSDPDPRRRAAGRRARRAA